MVSSGNSIFVFFFVASRVDREKSSYVFIAVSKQVESIPIHLAPQGLLLGGM